MKINNDAGNPGNSFGNLKPAEIKELSLIGKAMGHPVRVKLLQMFVSQGDWVCGKLVNHFDLAQSTISEHLRILLSANLIRREIYPGKGRRYCINIDTLNKYKVLLKKL